MSHENRHWHAEPNCFVCYTCEIPLVGKPFLPRYGVVFCSVDCCAEYSGAIGNESQLSQDRMVDSNSRAARKSTAKRSSRLSQSQSHQENLRNLAHPNRNKRSTSEVMTQSLLVSPRKPLEIQSSPNPTTVVPPSARLRYLTDSDTDEDGLDSDEFVQKTIEFAKGLIKEGHYESIHTFNDLPGSKDPATSDRHSSQHSYAEPDEVRRSLPDLAADLSISGGSKSRRPNVPGGGELPHRPHRRSSSASKSSSRNSNSATSSDSGNSRHNSKAHHHHHHQSHHHSIRSSSDRSYAKACANSVITTLQQRKVTTFGVEESSTPSSDFNSDLLNSRPTRSCRKKVSFKDRGGLDREDYCSTCSSSSSSEGEEDGFASYQYATARRLPFGQQEGAGESPKSWRSTKAYRAAGRERNKNCIVS